MKAYIRPIGISASDVYRFTVGGESVPIAVFRNSVVVQLFRKQIEAGADPTMHTFKLVEVDIQSKLVRDLGVINWRMDATFEHGITWQSVGPRQFIGVSPSGSQIYHGEQPERDEYALPMRIYQSPIRAGELLLPPAWSLVYKEGTAYCVSSWYPAIKVGIFRLASSGAQCETHTSHSNVPRSLSFLGPTINSLIYRGDSWFLVRVEAVDALAVVVLGPDFQLKAYTPPFTVEMESEETALGFDIIVSGEGNEIVVFAYISRGDVVIMQLPLESMLTFMI